MGEGMKLVLIPSVSQALPAVLSRVTLESPNNEGDLLFPQTRFRETIGLPTVTQSRVKGTERLNVLQAFVSNEQGEVGRSPGATHLQNWRNYTPGK